MLQVQDLSLQGVKLFKPKKFADDRGFFAETYNSRSFAEAGLAVNFVQDNLSLSSSVGTIRGLHYQSVPAQQGKLVRVTKGRIIDVVVDIRRSSPTFGQHLSVELTAESLDTLWVPVGFAHGFCTLVADTEVQYKVDNHYSPAHDLGIHWADRTLAIAWPVDVASATLSAKDQKLPPFDPHATYFQ